MYWVEVGKKMNKQAACGNEFIVINSVLKGRTEILILKHVVCPFYFLLEVKITRSWKTFLGCHRGGNLV